LFCYSVFSCENFSTEDRTSFSTAPVVCGG
jgi:hypothetical protein